jgi:hypothetical protein
MTRLRPLILTAIVVLFAHPALAGPPLLCFPFQIGDAKSLPMGRGDWHAVDPKYDVSHLVDDTVALLTPDAPVLVRMETLRRATLYAAAHPPIADALLAALERRATAGHEAVGLNVFDFGYLVETYKEAKFLFKAPIARLDAIDGYQLVLKARALRGDTAMDAAAKQISLGYPSKATK